MWTKFRFLTIFAALSFALTLSATTFEYDADGKQNQTIDGITIKLEKGGNTLTPAFSNYTGEMKLYAKNTIAVTGENLTSIQLVFYKNENKEYATLSTSVGTLVSGGISTEKKDYKVDTWTGSASSVIFTVGSTGQRIITQIVVNDEPIVIDPEVYIDDTPLDPEFAYSEPTAVITPDKNFFKKEYAFIDSNIRVYCTQGSILNNDTATYFNCNANNSISFEATQPIKGIVINGAVRKQFKATSDQGGIAYISPDEFYPDDYQECESAVIITDIDATKVTISCEKQLRCYSVYFYFDANPTQEIWDCDGSTPGDGETYLLDFDTADAVHETEISADEGKLNYTIYLFDSTAVYPYLALDLYPASADLTGTYDYEEGSLGVTTWFQYTPDVMERIWALEGQLVINKEGDIYSINGYITGDDNNTYNFTFSGKMGFFKDTDYYAEGIENVPAMDRNAPMYDILGRKVNDTYQGIVIQNGYKYMLK